MPLFLLKMSINFCAIELLDTTAALGNLTNIDRAQWDGVIIIPFLPKTNWGLPMATLRQTLRSGRNLVIDTIKPPFPSLEIILRKKSILLEYMCVCVSSCALHIIPMFTDEDIES